MDKKSNIGTILGLGSFFLSQKVFPMIQTSAIENIGFTLLTFILYSIALWLWLKETKNKVIGISILACLMIVMTYSSIKKQIYLEDHTVEFYIDDKRIDSEVIEIKLGEKYKHTMKVVNQTGHHLGTSKLEYDFGLGILNGMYGHAENFNINDLHSSPRVVQVGEFWIVKSSEAGIQQATIFLEPTNYNAISGTFKFICKQP